MLFEPGDLRFRPDSGQMEEDLDEVQHEKLNQILYEVEDQLEQHAQQDILLIIVYYQSFLFIVVAFF